MQNNTNTSKLLELAVENTNDAFVTIDDEHKVIFFNRAAEKIFGYGREEVIGRDLTTIMSPSCSSNHRQAVERYVRTRVPKLINHVNEIQAVRKTGETFPAEISFSVSELENRLYFTGIVRDLTETRQLKEQVHKTERLAALGQFVAEITHELKTPLLMIGAYARQLLKGNLEEGNGEKLRMIAEEVTRLENLLMELREFYQQRALDMEVFDISKLLRSVFALVEDDCREKQIDLEADICEEPLMVRGDRARLKQVFLNIIGNSIEATDKKGRITVRTEVSKDAVAIRFRDNGCGINENDREKIFSPFFSTKKHGTGLGLSITKDIIDRHEGCSLTVESEEGKGTEFKVSLPVPHHLSSS